MTVVEPRSWTNRLLFTAIVIATGLWGLALFGRGREKPPVSSRDQFEQWLTEQAREGDELWLYDSGPESWEHLAGECGYAIRRDGTVVAYWTHFEN